MTERDIISDFGLYNHWRTAEALFGGRGLTEEQQGKMLRRYKHFGIISPVDGPDGMLFRGSDINTLIQRRFQNMKLREEVKKELINSLDRKLDTLLEIQKKMSEQLEAIDRRLERVEREKDEGEEWRKK